MPEYLSPGVYVEEISTGPRPIEGVSTSNAGFVGQTERGPTAPRLVTSWPEYQRWYGGYIDPQVSYLPFAVKGFFDNGGQRAFIARVHSVDAGTSSLEVGGLRVTAIAPGAWGNQIYIRIANPGREDANRFKLTILYYSTPPAEAGEPLEDPLNPTQVNQPDIVEDYDGLGFDETGANYVISTVKGMSKLVELSWVNPSSPARPDNTANSTFTPLEEGSDGGGVTSSDYLGEDADGNLPNSPNDYTGLAGLEVIDEVNLLCVPDHVHSTLFQSVGADAARIRITTAITNQCEQLKDRFAVLQTLENRNDANSIDPPIDSSYGAIYYPWVRVFDPRINDAVKIPPGGHVTGIIARTDIERGVHKAPANAVVRGIITSDLSGNRKPVEYQVTKGHQDILNPKGVNVIRDFRSDGRSIRVWGARTMSSDPQWKYVNVRRLFLFVEESIDEGTQWVVFEPNHEPTWAAVRRSLTNFLITVWRSGALMGVTQDEAFFVKCDRTTMTQDDIDNGRLICFIGIAPVKPAEFVIFRISQKTVEATA